MNELKHLFLIADKMDKTKLQEIETCLNKREIEFNYQSPQTSREKTLAAFKNYLLSNEVIEESPDKFEKAILKELKLDSSPDLIIKVGKDQTSLEDSAIIEANYAEIFFINKDSASLSLDDIEIAINDYQQRQRNFGK